MGTILLDEDFKGPAWFPENENGTMAVKHKDKYLPVPCKWFDTRYDDEDKKLVWTLKDEYKDKITYIHFDQPEEVEWKQSVKDVK